MWLFIVIVIVILLLASVLFFNVCHPVFSCQYCVCVLCIMWLLTGECVLHKPVNKIIDKYIIRCVDIFICHSGMAKCRRMCFITLPTTPHSFEETSFLNRSAVGREFVSLNSRDKRLVLVADKLPPKHYVATLCHSATSASLDSKYYINKTVQILGTTNCLSKHLCCTKSSNGSTTPRKWLGRWNRTTFILKKMNLPLTIKSTDFYVNCHL